MNELEELKEEIYCTKFELDTLAELILNGKAERWVPYFTGLNKDKDHISRYELAANYVKDLKVLDIACGAGKGSKLLAEKGGAASVLGADVDADSVRYASHRHGGKNISFHEIDGTRLTYVREFDVVVSFETIEHIKLFDIFLHNIRGALKENGIFIVSTPISPKELDANPLNPYHMQEWGFHEFHKVLEGAGFMIEKIYTQLDFQLGGPTLFQRIKKRLLNRKGNIHHFTGYDEKKIEEYKGQYDVSEFGTMRNGFQIAVCKKAI